ncbi:MAG: LCP family protein [Chloroflexi bacterium]|nr:LCP family protein [Chloroflexota bacterium]
MKFKKLFLLLIGFTFIIFSACALSELPPLFIQTTTVQVSPQFATVDPNATNTATPFLSMGPTATATSTSRPTKTSTPASTLTPSMTPTPSLPDGQVNIMVFGNDYRPSSGYRTDTMILVSINTIEKIVNAISLPRDLYVEIPGHGYDRLNTAMPYGGFDLFQQTMQINFNIKPDFYIMTNFTGFANIINSIGGIDVNAARNLYDSCDLPQAVNGYCSAGAGIVHMDGETALWYVRSRYTSNDFDRNRRQQEVMLAILKNLLQVDLIANAADLYNGYRSAVDTNLELEPFIKLLPTIISLNEEGHLNRYAIDASYTTNYWTEQGAAVLLPNQEMIWDLIRTVIYQQ